VQYVFWAPLTAFTAALIINWWLAGSKLAAITLDHPNRRSLHHSPVPRTGGIGMLAGILIALGTLVFDVPGPLWPALGILLAISLANDVREIAAPWRLGAHLLAAAVFVTGTLAEHGPVVMAAAALAIAWMANLYNFMDGSDGLAGGMAVFGFSVYGVAAALAGGTEFALVNFSIAAAAAAFLIFNFHPARIFMGDAGSIPFGFLAAALGITGWLRNDWTWWFPLLVFSPFIVDASVTLARRAWKRERLWEAHRDHYYQRLVRMGWGHRKTAIAEYVLMAASGAMALAALGAQRPAQLAVIAAAGLAYLSLIAAVESAWRKFRAGIRNEA
jgi:UDP-N-acetylmuramyl pentapeptide phosphotransferase/UDP-N-acetylglucosamine-1-phosphate transferase